MKRKQNAIFTGTTDNCRKRRNCTNSESPTRAASHLCDNFRWKRKWSPPVTESHLSQWNFHPESQKRAIEPEYTPNTKESHSAAERSHTASAADGSASPPLTNTIPPCSPNSFHSKLPPRSPSTKHQLPIYYAFIYSLLLVLFLGWTGIGIGEEKEGFLFSITGVDAQPAPAASECAENMWGPACVYVNCAKFENASLQFHLSFDDPVEPVIDSVSGQVGSYSSGSVTVDTGKFGNGASLSDGAFFPMSPSLNVDTQDFSVCLWVKNPSSQFGLFYNTRESIAFPGHMFGLSSRNMYIQMSIGGQVYGQYTSSPTPIYNTDQWHLLCLVDDRGNSLTYYHDASVVEKKLGGYTQSLLSPLSEFSIGSYRDKSKKYTDMMDEFMFFHGALNQTNIETLFSHQCKIPTCNETLSTNSSVCNGVGECVDLDTCTCPYGYVGQNCETALCFGIWGNQSSVCSSHGSCESLDSCNCFPGYGGDNCEWDTCHGIPSNETEVCSSHGSCVAPNNCSCTLGYAGNECDLYVCHGVLSDQSNVCSGHGLCTDIDTCSCSFGYTGVNCELTMCNGILSNESSVCTNGRGNCTSPNRCVCAAGYGGSECEYYTCGNVPSNSPFVCYRRGTCYDIDACNCTMGYAGPLCEHKICYGILSNESNVCHSNGFCFAPDTCICSPGYVGATCRDLKVFAHISGPTQLKVYEDEVLTLDGSTSHALLSNEPPLPSDVVQETYSWKCLDFLSGSPCYHGSGPMWNVNASTYGMSVKIFHLTYKGKWESLTSSSRTYQVVEIVPRPVDDDDDDEADPITYDSDAEVKAEIDGQLEDITEVLGSSSSSPPPISELSDIIEDLSEAYDLSLNLTNVDSSQISAGQEVVHSYLQHLLNDSLFNDTSSPDVDIPLTDAYCDSQSKALTLLLEVTSNLDAWFSASSSELIFERMNTLDIFATMCSVESLNQTLSIAENVIASYAEQVVGENMSLNASTLSASGMMSQWIHYCSDQQIRFYHWINLREDESSRDPSLGLRRSGFGSSSSSSSDGDASASVMSNGSFSSQKGWIQASFHEDSDGYLFFVLKTSRFLARDFSEVVFSDLILTLVYHKDDLKEQTGLFDGIKSQHRHSKLTAPPDIPDEEDEEIPTHTLDVPDDGGTATDEPSLPSDFPEPFTGDTSTSEQKHQQVDYLSEYSFELSGSFSSSDSADFVCGASRSQNSSTLNDDEWHVLEWCKFELRSSSIGVCMCSAFPLEAQDIVGVVHVARGATPPVGEATSEDWFLSSNMLIIGSLSALIGLSFPALLCCVVCVLLIFEVVCCGGYFALRFSRRKPRVLHSIDDLFDISSEKEPETMEESELPRRLRSKKNLYSPTLQSSQVHPSPNTLTDESPSGLVLQSDNNSPHHPQAPKTENHLLPHHQNNNNNPPAATTAMMSNSEVTMPPPAAAAVIRTNSYSNAENNGAAAVGYLGVWQNHEEDENRWRSLGV